MRAQYPGAFETFWAATWKMGAKGDACKAWKQAGCPAIEAARPAIEAYLAAKKRSGQTLAGVAVWLRAGGATQTEWHLATISKTNGAPATNGAATKPAPYHAPFRGLPGLREWESGAGEPWPTKRGEAK